MIVPHRTWILVAGLLGGLAVACGAFGAHGLKAWAEQNWPATTRAQRLENWEVAVRYQMYHALALVGASILCRAAPRWGHAAALSMTLGTLVFSGCLYAYALTGQRAWGAVVPVGGGLLLVGWACWMAAALSLATPPASQRQRPDSSP